MKLNHPTDSPEELDSSAAAAELEAEMPEVAEEPQGPAVTTGATRMELRRRKKRRKLIRLISIISAALLASGVSYYLLATTVVPSAPAYYVELSADDPCEEFEAIGATCSVSFKHSDSVARDKLISQEPAAGFSLIKPAVAKLVYSSGPERSEFPDILRQDYDEALKELYLIGVEVDEIKTVEKDDLGPNRIVSASIEAGKTVKSGAKVNLEVSAETVDLPELKGLTREQVELDLEKLGLDPEIIEEASIDPVGTVIGQTPAPGTVAKGSKVTVKIAKAEEIKSIKVPTVIGLTEDEANGVLAAAGFKNIAVAKVESSRATEARVTTVAPGEGRSVRSDSNVVIVVTIPEAKQPTPSSGL